MRRVFVLLLVGAVASAQGKGHRQANANTLGLVVYEKQGKVVVAQTLAKSPAAKAGVKAGDVLVRVGPRDVKRHNDVDFALRSWSKDKTIELDLVRSGKKLHLLMKPTPLVGFTHPYLRPAERKRTGFAAPAWHAFGWVNVARGKQPPTLANTKGKVVVIHCFQSW